MHKHIPSVQVRAKIDCKVLAFFIYKTSDYFGLFLIYNEYSERPPKRGRLFFLKKMFNLKKMYDFKKDVRNKKELPFQKRCTLKKIYGIKKDVRLKKIYRFKKDVQKRTAQKKNFGFGKDTQSKKICSLKIAAKRCAATAYGIDRTKEEYQLHGISGKDRFCYV